MSEQWNTEIANSPMIVMGENCGNDEPKTVSGQLRFTKLVRCWDCQHVDDYDAFPQEDINPGANKACPECKSTRIATICTPEGCLAVSDGQTL